MMSHYESLYNSYLHRYSRESEALRCARDNAELSRDNLQKENKKLEKTIYEIQQDLSVIRAQRESEL